MRVVIVTESFPPDVNGVAHCALQTARHLVRSRSLSARRRPGQHRRHGRAGPGPTLRRRAPSSASPPCRSPATPRSASPCPAAASPRPITEHRADLVHLASPFVLGVRGMAAAARLGIPAVAVYQTDLAGYARTYIGAGEAAAWRRIRAVHAAADLTLAPSSASAARPGDARRAPGPAVAARRRHRPLPPRAARRGAAPRTRPERRADRRLRRPARPREARRAPGRGLRPATACGSSSSATARAQPTLREALPGAVFLGRRTGDDLARIFASLDVFAHTGPFETFCQTVQEAMASGVPVVAPAAGGPLDLVAHGRTGLLVPPRDADAVRDAVRSLAADPALRAALRRRRRGPRSRAAPGRPSATS